MLLGMFGLGPAELVIIAIVAVLLFGSRLPKLMYSLGNGLVQFKKGLQGVDEDIRDVGRDMKRVSKDVAKDLEDQLASTDLK